MEGFATGVFEKREGHVRGKYEGQMSLREQRACFAG